MHETYFCDDFRPMLLPPNDEGVCRENPPVLTLPFSEEQVEAIVDIEIKLKVLAANEAARGSHRLVKKDWSDRVRRGKDASTKALGNLKELQAFNGPSFRFIINAEKIARASVIN